MDEQQQQLIDRITQAQNILVAVSSNPSVDQLSAALGLTLALNKLDKHGTAVFSGKVPSTLEFLKPEETLEKNTDSLRDFIIALDKSKADKLRYKVEDDVVRIFITPYKTSISQKDLQFSQGDFNVDVVICLGVTEQQDLDTAITAHGRILHDATVASVSTVGQGSLGAINWVDPTASSLSEMIVSLADGLDKSVMDAQIATALLTGIVATTERFRNDKTTPKTMSASAELMAAGANQQLIATELETPAPQPAAKQPKGKPAAEDSDKPDAKPDKKAEPGTLEIDHEAEDTDSDEQSDEPAAPSPQIAVNEDGKLTELGDNTDQKETQAPAEPPIKAADEAISAVRGVANDGTPSEKGKRRERMTEPPKLNDGDLTANTQPEALDPPTEELSLPTLQAAPLLSHDEPRLPSTPAPAPSAPAAFQPAPASWQPPVSDDETLTEIEQSVESPHLQTKPAEATASDTTPQDPETGVDDARSAVEAALRGGGPQNDPLQPIEALNAQPLGPELNPPTQPFAPPSLPSVDPSAPSPVPNAGFSEPSPGNSPADETLDMPLPTSGFGAPATSPFSPPPATGPGNPSAFPGAPASDSNNSGPMPPPVPPPMLPPLQ